MQDGIEKVISADIFSFGPDHFSFKYIYLYFAFKRL